MSRKSFSPYSLVFVTPSRKAYQARREVNHGESVTAGGSCSFLQVHTCIIISSVVRNVTHVFVGGITVPGMTLTGSLLEWITLIPLRLVVASEDGARLPQSSGEAGVYHIFPLHPRTLQHVVSLPPLVSLRQSAATDPLPVQPRRASPPPLLSQKKAISPSSFFPSAASGLKSRFFCLAGDSPRRWFFLQR